MQDVSVYGSCVARDVVRVASDSFDLERYYARSSWISSTSAPVPLPSVESKLTSAFQKKMVEIDYQSRALEGVLGSKSELILLDLVDERLGVYPVKSGGYVTWLNELNHSGWLSHTPHGSLIEFGSDKHFALFETAAKNVARKLEERNAVLLRVLFADARDDGGEVPKTNNRAAREWNELYDRYYGCAAEAGLKVLEVPAELCVSSAEHMWGPAQYHYADGFYHWVAQQVS